MTAHDRSSSSQVNTPENTSPVRERKRVLKACDQCRSRKSKCDGKQPCLSCTLYGYTCKYGRTRRKTTPQYLNELETKLQQLENLVTIMLPGVNLDDPNLQDSVLAQARALRHEQDSSSQANEDAISDTTAPSSQQSPTDNIPDESKERLLDTMIEATGRLEIDDRGNRDWHGRFAGFTFIQRMREHCEKLLNGDLDKQDTSESSFIDPSKQSRSIRLTKTPEALESLPGRKVARELSFVGLEIACCHMRFVHRPTFYRMFERIYDLDPESYSDAEYQFFPLLFAILSLGVLFVKEGNGNYDIARVKYEASKYFHAGERLIDITDCRDLTSLQALICMIMYLQTCRTMSVCYSYISVAMSSALRMGLHRSDVSKNLSLVEVEVRKRAFWVLRTMDTYVATLLGLPRTISDEDVNQQMPLEIDDELIMDSEILPMPAGHISIIAATNAHTSLIMILAKIVKYIYSAPNDVNGNSGLCRVDYSRVLELEGDLERWYQHLTALSTSTSFGVTRAQLVLRVAYSHVQMVLYRPFLHHAIRRPSDSARDMRSYACASACIKAAKQVIELLKEMYIQDFLNGPDWFFTYLTYFAVMSLVTFILNNQDDASAQGYIAVAESGRQILNSLGVRSSMANRCAASLTPLFEKLSTTCEASDGISQPKLLRLQTNNSLLDSCLDVEATNTNSNLLQTSTLIHQNHSSQGENATVPMHASQCYLPEMSTQPFICTNTPQHQPVFEGSQHQGLSESLHNPTESAENPFDPSMDSGSSIEGSLWSLGPYGMDKQPMFSQNFDFFPHLDTLGGSMDFGT